MEKWRAHYRNDVAENGSHVKGFARFLFVFQALTQIYVTLNYLIPFVYEDFDPWVQYYLKVFAFYLFIMCMTNWLCVILYSSEYVPSRDRPDVDTRQWWERAPERFGSNTSLIQAASNLGSRAAVDVSEKGGLPWKYCQKCQMDIPPRAHHCRFCRRCILRRDHHCFLIGCCIGHWNQRYFVVLAGYATVVGYYGAYLTITYLRYHHDNDMSLWVYFLPCTAYKVTS